MRTTLLCLAVIGCSSNDLNNNNDQSINDLSMMADMGPDQGAMACDPIKQDCPSGQKCAVAGGGMMMMAMGACVMAGTVTEGMPCMRGMMGAPDNCAAGLTCSGRTGGVCRKYCAANTDCLTGQACGAGRGNAPVGTCAPTCAPFGNACGAQNCSTITNVFGSTTGDVFFTCRTPGTGNPFDDCGMGGVTCGPDSFCDGTNQWCAPLCDSSHTCPAKSGDGGVAVSCMSLGTTLTGDPGFCGP